MGSILIIDDDSSICRVLEMIVRRAGYDVTSAQSLAQGLGFLSSNPVDLVFLDVRLPDGNGLEVIPLVRESATSPEIIIITGEADPDGAELAISSGAWDYLQKPFTQEDVLLPVERAMQYRGQRQENRLPVALERHHIIGRCGPMRYAFDMLAKAAACEASVLITGETGTGKELFARAVHDNSARSGGAFVVVDCAALPETLVESLLFGHEKGAFTGANASRSGLIKEADGGTLFLDEIGDLQPSAQKTLLRVLQEHRFRPVGGAREVSSSFRLVAATNRDLDGMCEEGGFRSDLLYRLRSIVINLPPLRQRGRDVIDLAMHYMRMYCERLSIGTKGFSPEFFEMISGYNWPGNVRELSHAMEQAVSLAKEDPTLFHLHLPVHIRTYMARASVSGREGGGAGWAFERSPRASFPPVKAVLEDVERQYLRDLAAMTGWDMEKACEVSGLSRSRLYERLKRYGIQKPSK
jgi:two-component system, NtrC family, response regulator